MVVRVKKERNVGVGNCAMPGAEPGQIHGQHRVAVHDQKFRLELTERGEDRPRRSAWFTVVDQADGNRQVDADQPFADRIGPVVHHHQRVGEAMRAQKFELMQEQRLAAHVHERFGQAFEHRSEPRALSPGKNDRLLHGGFS